MKSTVQSRIDEVGKAIRIRIKNLDKDAKEEVDGLNTRISLIRGRCNLITIELTLQLDALKYIEGNPKPGKAPNNGPVPSRQN